MSEELIEHLQHDISLKDKQIEALKAQYNLSFNEVWRTRIELNALRTAFSKETDALRSDRETLWQVNAEADKTIGELRASLAAAQAENGRLREPLRKLVEACELADYEGELTERVYGELMDEARAALKESEK